MLTSELKKIPPSAFVLPVGWHLLIGSPFREVESEMFAWMMLRTQQAQGDGWRPVRPNDVYDQIQLDYFERQVGAVRLVTSCAWGGIRPHRWNLFEGGFIYQAFGDYITWTDKGVEALFTHLESRGGLLLW